MGIVTKASWNRPANPPQRGGLKVYIVNQP